LYEAISLRTLRRILPAHFESPFFPSPSPQRTAAKVRKEGTTAPRRWPENLAAENSLGSAILPPPETRPFFFSSASPPCCDRQPRLQSMAFRRRRKLTCVGTRHAPARLSATGKKVLPFLPPLVFHSAAERPPPSLRIAYEKDNASGYSPISKNGDSTRHMHFYVSPTPTLFPLFLSPPLSLPSSRAREGPETTSKQKSEQLPTYKRRIRIDGEVKAPFFPPSFSPPSSSSPLSGPVGISVKER